MIFFDGETGITAFLLIAFFTGKTDVLSIRQRGGLIPVLGKLWMDPYDTLRVMKNQKQAMGWLRCWQIKEALSPRIHNPVERDDQTQK
jgi:hypothetical protein